MRPGSSDPADWVWSETNARWEDGDDNPIDFGSDNDQNRITAITYDLGGRVIRNRDAAGVETRYEYDALGRRVKTITNYVDGVYSGAAPDEDLISETVYNQGGQVVSTVDARSTETTFAYDHAGRRLTVTRAANSALSSVDYTCYDKAGRVLRTIQNWVDDESDPDAQDEYGDWVFVPGDHGTENDRDLVMLFAYDRASRRVQITDAAGNVSSTSYFKDGQVEGLIDPETAETHYRYDGLRRRVRVVQGFVDQGEDPALWLWDSGWKQSDNTTAINHGTDNDENIIVDVAYDVAGRVVSQRNPRGYVTSYTYDQLNRRLTLTNPLSNTWETAYADLSSGGTRVTMTYPGITGAADYEVERNFDRLGRLLSIAYGDPGDTPDVKLAYDAAGNRAKVSEYSGSGFTSRSRETNFSYDAMRRMAAVEFDTDGDGTGEESVSYAYDAGGLRTRLTLPGDLDIVYAYDERGRLISLTDWDDQETAFGYDLANRHLTTERVNQFHSAYRYDAAGRLKRLRHTKAGGDSFPTTGVLDNFNRSNGGIGGNWGWTPSGYSIVGNEMVVGSGDLIYWNPNTFSADQEVFVTLIAIDGDADEIDLILKMQSTDWNDGILELWYQAANGVVEVVTYDQTAGWVQHGSDISVTFAPGDQFGARALADGTVEVYKNGVLVGSRDASAWTYAANGGYVGLWNLNAAGTVLDDFGGGDVVTGAGNTTLAHFEYEVDGRGNRTQALEVLAHPETTSDTVIAYNDKGLVLSGTWSEVSSFKESTQTNAILKLMFLGDEVTLTMGKGSDHSIYDVYLDGAFWQSVDGYAASATQEDIVITGAVLLDEGPHTLEIRNQNTKNASSNDYKVRFKQALVADKTWTLHTVEYSYDALARLLEARYNPGLNVDAVDADLLRRYLYAYDRTGNRLQESVALNGGSPTVASYTYNAANQISNGGYSYDANGNLIDDDTNTYAWDRANRLVQWENGVAADTVAYGYDGLGNRVSQAVGTISPTITQYLLDLQPGLAVVLAETIGANVIRNVHAPRGIHAHKDAAGAWEWMVQDALGSVRGMVDNTVDMLWSGSPAPYGGYFSEAGTRQTNYGFTGEQTDSNGLLYLRARYYHPAAGVFTALDPFEGIPNRLMSLNGYLYVEGNVPNLIDRSGLFSCIGESSAVASACSELDSALRRRPALYGQLRPIEATTNSDGTLAFRNLETRAEDLFRVRLGLSGLSTNAIPEPNCSNTSTPNELETAKVTLLRTVAAMIHVSARFQEAAFPRPIDLFRERIGRNGILSIQLNASTGVVYDCGTGLTQSSSDNLFLGSCVQVPTIVHELGHAFDRGVGYRASEPIRDLWLRDKSLTPTYNPDVDTSFEDPARSVSSSRGLIGRANYSDDQTEVWADMFMTWVMANQGLEVTGRLNDGSLQTRQVGWDYSFERSQASFKSLYTRLAVQRLALNDGFFPAVGSNHDEHLRFIRLVTELINVAEGRSH